MALLSLVLAVFQPLMVGAAPPVDPSAVLFAVNAGGPEVGVDPVWEQDLKFDPSPYVNSPDSGRRLGSTSTTIDLSDPSIPVGTLPAVFADYRLDVDNGTPMEWDFPVPSGTDVEVQLFFVETWSGAYSPGVRVFDVSVEGSLLLDDYDIWSDVGPATAVMKSTQLTSDGNIDIDFGTVTEKPIINGIQIVDLGSTSTPLPSLAAVPDALDFGAVAPDAPTALPVDLTNVGVAASGPLTISGATVTGADAAEFTGDFSPLAGQVLAPGESVSTSVTSRRRRWRGRVRRNSR